MALLFLAKKGTGATYATKEVWRALPPVLSCLFMMAVTAFRYIHSTMVHARMPAMGGVEGNLSAFCDKGDQCLWAVSLLTPTATEVPLPPTCLQDDLHHDRVRQDSRDVMAALLAGPAWQFVAETDFNIRSIRQALAHLVTYSPLWLPMRQSDTLRAGLIAGFGHSLNTHMQNYTNKDNHLLAAMRAIDQCKRFRRCYVADADPAPVDSAIVRGWNVMEDQAVTIPHATAALQRFVDDPSALFRGEQVAMMSNILARRHQLVCLPCGGGKSLPFLLYPALEDVAKTESRRSDTERHVNRLAVAIVPFVGEWPQCVHWTPH